LNQLNSNPIQLPKPTTTTTTTTKMSPARKALIAITSAKATLNKETTGLFISEALHPYNVLTAAGFEVDLASETGSYTADWLSQTPDFLNGDDLTIWNDTNSEFRKKLDNMPKASELDPSKYGVFYASAGHAALIDYPTATSLQKVAEAVWATGGVVASVCHGPAIFANILDSKTGRPIIEGRRITGFTTEAENNMGIMGDLRSWNVELCEELAERLGAKCEFFLCIRVGFLVFLLTLMQMSAPLVFGMTSMSLMVILLLDRTLPVLLPLLRLLLMSLRSCRSMFVITQTLSNCYLC
jgi:putative intracellular protease/amidase